MTTGVFFTGSWVTRANAGLPADKVTFTSDTVEVQGPNSDKVILSQQMRTSTVGDLVFNISAECAITTALTSMNDGSTNTAEGSIKMWIQVDGVTVPVSAGGNDDGKVVFCDRVDSRTQSTELTSSIESDSIQTYQKTKQADTFIWAVPNIGNGIHTIKVHADLEQCSGDATCQGDATATAVIGARSLDTEPTTQVQFQGT